MNRIRNAGAMTAVVFFALVSLSAAAHGAPGTPTAAVPEQDALHAMTAYFEAHPELQEPGHGWNPYKRIEWFYEQRRVEGKLPEWGARWREWERMRGRYDSRRAGAGNQWFSLGPTNLAGRMKSIDFDPTDPSIVYVGGADGGVWKSTDSGTTWTPLSDELPSLAVCGLAVSKTNPDIIVIATGEATPSIDAVKGVGILRSTDGGDTWVTTSKTLSAGTNHGFYFAECGPNGTFLAGADDSLYRSTDDGATWHTRPAGAGEWYDAKWSTTDPDKVFFVRAGGVPGARVKVSTDDGATWSNAGSGQPASLNFGRARLGISGTTIYCIIGQSGFSDSMYGLIKSTDDGATWSTLPSTGLPSGQVWWNLSCAADPDNADRVIVGAVGLARSNDGGMTFSSVRGSNHTDNQVLEYEPGSNDRVWLCNDGGMYVSDTDGALNTWTEKNDGLVTYQFYDICVNNGPTSPYVLGGTQDQGTNKWTGGTTWTKPLGADGMVCNISPFNGTTVYAEYQYGFHWRSLNSGGSWFTFNNGLPSCSGNQWVVPVALDPGDPFRLLTNDNCGGGIYRSTNGTSWSFVDSHQATWLDVSPVDSQVAWSISGSAVRVSTDFGTTWTATSMPFSTGVGTKVLADPIDADVAYATFSGYTAFAHIARTTDQGATWTDVSGDFTGMPVNAIAVDPSNPGDWYIGTDVGVWYSGNGGANWIPFETGLPNAVVVDLEIDDGGRKLVAGTHGRGAWEVAIKPTGVDAPDGGPGVAVGPGNLMLDRPWPNPASDRAVLRYAARSDADVRLRVYDVQGRLVSDLDTPRGDGIIRTTSWLTADVPAGVYFAVLEAGSDRVSRKVTVIK